MNRLLSLLALILAMSTGCIPDPISPEDQLKTDIKKIEEYLTDNGLSATSTESGLHYIIDEAGTGSNPSIDDDVTVHYKGYLLNGNVFDETGANPVTFALKNLILGWQEGIPLLKKGGKGTFFLPSYLGYGTSSPSSEIPSNSVLIFEIELVDF